MNWKKSELSAEASHRAREKERCHPGNSPRKLWGCIRFCRCRTVPPPPPVSDCPWPGLASVWSGSLAWWCWKTADDRRKQFAVGAAEQSWEWAAAEARLDMHGEESHTAIHERCGIYIYNLITFWYLAAVCPGEFLASLGEMMGYRA